MSMTFSVRVQSDDFDMSAEVEKLHAGNKAIGGIVAFTGFCRDEDGTLSALEIEHYPDMAEKHISAIVKQAKQRWPLIGITVIHRFGYIKAGEQIVLVATSSSHRRAAFEAADFIMDYLKTEAPFWKKEHLANGETSDWVMAKDEDDETKRRWL